MSTLRDDIYDGIWLILLRMRNASYKSCGQTENTHFIANNLSFFLKIVPYTAVSTSTQGFLSFPVSTSEC